MPPTRRELVALAASQIGTWESPLGSNRTKFGAAYGWNGVAWCQIGDWWVAMMSGLSHLKTASTMAAVADARKAGTWHDGIAGIQPGDSLYFHWPESSRAKNQPDHVETCELALGGGAVQTIGANVSNGWRRQIRRANILGHIRHVFAPDSTIALPSAGLVVVHRLYNKANGNHLTTASAHEAQSLAANRDWRYEGVAWEYDPARLTAPVWRFFNRKTGKHFYTASMVERLRVQVTGWSFEGVAFHCGGTRPVWRFFNPKAGTHFYTASEAEKNTVVAKLSRTYKLEGVGFYV